MGSVKTNNGKVRQIVKVPNAASTTDNRTNQFEAERLRNAACKEDKLLERMSDARDHAWHPDTFFHDSAGDDDSLPWAVKPADILSSSAMLQRIVEAYTQSRTAEKKRRKDEKKKDKKA